MEFFFYLHKNFSNYNIITVLENRAKYYRNAVGSGFNVPTVVFK